MSGDVFFKIDGSDLILEKTLVEYNGLPLFFVCKNNEEYYIACTLDLEKEQYIVVKTNLYNLRCMLKKEMTMRRIILLAENYWHIVVGEEVEEDIVVKKSISEIPLQELPYEDSYLEIVTKELQNYAKEIEERFSKYDMWEEKIVESYTYCGEDLQAAFERIVDAIIESTEGKNLYSIQADERLLSAA